MPGTTKVFYMYIIDKEVIHTDFDKCYQTSEEWMPVGATSCYGPSYKDLFKHNLKLMCFDMQVCLDFNWPLLLFIKLQNIILILKSRSHLVIQ